MFLSTSHNKIDKKGRVSVPRNFRTYLDLEGGSLILFKSLQLKCIEGTTLKRISQYVEAIDEIDAMSKDASILRMMMADSFEIKYDNEGRINIPESLLSYADIDDIAVFAGIGKSFMIWSDIEYAKEIRLARLASTEAKERNEKPELEIATISASVTSLFTA